MQKMTIRPWHKTLIFIFIFFGWCFTAQAAYFYIAPPTGVYVVGEPVEVEVRLNSEGVAVSAVEGTITFDVREIEIVSINKKSDIVGSWLTEPSFSNANGTIVFSGAIKSGVSSDVVLGLTLKGKIPEKSRIEFSSGAALTADGKGSNLISELKSATLTFVPKNITPVAEGYGAAEGVPLAPVISSVTHPDQNSWYNNTNPEFSWNISTDTEAVRIQFDKEPNSIPKVFYSEPISKKRLEKIKDGVWYFHVQAKNSKGWSAVSHFRFSIDSESPVINSVAADENAGVSRKKITVLATDIPSGIAYYEVKINDQNAFQWRDDGGHFFETPVLTGGSHVAEILVFDLAGNSTSTSVSFAVERRKAPGIAFASVPGENFFKIKGSTDYPDSDISLWIEKAGAPAVRIKMKTDGTGNFSHDLDRKSESGSFRVWAAMTEGESQISDQSEILTVVIQPQDVLGLSAQAVKTASIGGTIGLFAIFMFIAAWYGLRRFMLLRKKLRGGILTVESSVEKEFDDIKRDIEEQLVVLQKVRQRRELTIAERLFEERLARHVKKSRATIIQRIKMVKDKINEKDEII